MTGLLNDAEESCYPNPSSEEHGRIGRILMQNERTRCRAHLHWLYRAALSSNKFAPKRARNEREPTNEHSNAYDREGHPAQEPAHHDNITTNTLPTPWHRLTHCAA